MLKRRRIHKEKNGQRKGELIKRIGKEMENWLREGEFVKIGKIGEENL